MTKKNIGIYGAAAGVVAATTIAVVNLPDKEEPYVWGGFAKEVKEVQTEVMVGPKVYQVRWLYDPVGSNGQHTAQVSVWEKGKQVGKDFAGTLSFDTNRVQVPMPPLKSNVAVRLAAAGVQRAEFRTNEVMVPNNGMEMVKRVMK